MNRFILKCQTGDHFDKNIQIHHFESERSLEEERADLEKIWEKNHEDTHECNWFDFNFKGRNVYSYWQPEIIPFEEWYGKICLKI
jgi:hypothetical protein